MAIDLSPAREALEDQMTMTIDVHRDKDRFQDSVFDEETGTMTQTPDDIDDIVLGQKCMLLPKNQKEEVTEEGGASVLRDEFTLWLPLESPVLLKSDAISIQDVGVDGDPDLIGSVLYIDSEVKPTSVPIGKKYIACTARPQAFHSV